MHAITRYIYHLMIRVERLFLRLSTHFSQNFLEFLGVPNTSLTQAQASPPAFLCCRCCESPRLTDDDDDGHPRILKQISTHHTTPQPLLCVSFATLNANHEINPRAVHHMLTVTPPSVYLRRTHRNRQVLCCVVWCNCNQRSASTFAIGRGPRSLCGCDIVVGSKIRKDVILSAPRN